MKKMFSLPDKYVTYIKNEANKLEIAESDMLRRIIDRYIEQTDGMIHTIDNHYNKINSWPSNIIELRDGTNG